MANWYVRLLDSEWETDFSEICIPEIDFCVCVGYRGHRAHTECAVQNILFHFQQPVKS